MVTGRAGRRADIKTAKVAHSGADAGIVGPILPSVTAEPIAGRAVTSFAGNAFVRVRFGSEPAWPDGLKRRMANCAARAVFRGAGTHTFGDPLRPRVQKDGERFRVIILLAPGEILAAFRSGPAMAARRLTAGGADEHRVAGLSNLPRLFRNQQGR